MSKLNKSILEKKFDKFLNNKSIKIISFDIFETLVFRKVTKPSDIFHKVGKKAYVKNIFLTASSFKQFRIEAEKKARIKYSKQEDVNLSQIYRELNLTKKQQNKIMSIEIKEEYKSIFINQEIKLWIEKALDKNKKVIFISDMYLSTSQLNRIVFSKIKIKNSLKNLYVSNEYKKTKAIGTLYTEILDKSNIQANEMLHIGDNINSDINMAIQKKINTIYYNCNISTNKMLELEYTYLNYGLNKGQNYRILSTLKNPYKDPEKEFFFNLGATIFGPILWEFSHWLKDMCNEKNIEQINFLMREGRIFKKYFDRINRDIDTNLIYASRKSTYLASINLKKIEKNGFSFYGFRKFNIENFYDLFKLNIKDPFIEKNKNVFFKNAHDIFKNDLNLVDIVSSDFTSRIQEVKHNISKERKLFKQYLKENNYKHNSLLVDFGSTGTVFKNIQELLNNKNTHKYNALFHMNSSGFNKHIKSNIFSFLPFSLKSKKKIELIKRTPEFIEALFNGIEETTTSYKKNMSNNIKATTTQVINNTKQHQKIVSSFDNGISSFFNTMQSYNIKNKLYSKQELLSIMTRVIEVPTKEEVKYLGEIEFDEGNGSNITNKIISKKNIKKVKEIGIENTYYQHSKCLSFENGTIPWIQGTITKINDSYIGEVKKLHSIGVNEDSINKILNNIENLNITKTFIFGAGQFAQELIPQLQEKNISVEGIIDSKAKLNKFIFNNMTVTYLEKTKLYNHCNILIASGVFKDNIKTIINAYSIKNNININIL